MSYLTKLKETVSKDFKEAKTPEEVKKLQSYIDELKLAEEEELKFIEQHTKLKNDYVEALKTSVFSESGKQETNKKVKTPEEILKELKIEGVEL